MCNIILGKHVCMCVCVSALTKSGLLAILPALMEQH